MKYGSVCSGIEAFSVAVNGMGWRPSWFAEIDPFCCALLKARYPEVENYGDITTKATEDFAKVDVIVGGTPCQSFSRQGNQSGLADPRGQLAMRFVDLVRAGRPDWVVWENVPGVVTCEQGRAFRQFVTELADCGYGVAWRILDARYFGVAQRRRRMFVVGCRGRSVLAGAVLFEPRADSKNDSSIGKIQEGNEPAGDEAVPSIVGWSGDETPKCGGPVVPTLRASGGGEGFGIVGGGRVSRLTMDEWEILSGLPVGYTDLGPEWSDSQRKHAIGNSMVTGVMRWIAQGIAKVDEVAT